MLVEGLLILIEFRYLQKLFKCYYVGVTGLEHYMG
jgi:hypothetical protein